MTKEDLMEKAGETLTVEIETTASGGKNTRLYCSMTEVPPSALLEVAKVMKEGAKGYGSKNWHNISVMSELDHALEHAYRFIAFADETKGADGNMAYCIDELSHAAARMLMALDQFLRQPNYLQEKEPSDV